jgi:hypothetical protein
MIGKLLGTVVRIVNAPAKTIDKIIRPEEAGLPRISTPLEELAKTFEEIDEKGE